MIEPADLFRVYDARECGPDGYPHAWHGTWIGEGPIVTFKAVKDLVRENAGNRCLRCHHPYAKGDGEWSACDERCTHGAPDTRGRYDVDEQAEEATLIAVEAQWRILTVHHLLTGPEGKRNLRWWNLVSLCQRCHLTIQRRVDLNRVWPWPHSEWFRPYAAGWYAFAYLGENLSREETMARLPELLALENLETVT